MEIGPTLHDLRTDRNIRVRDAKIRYATEEKNAGMSRVQLNSEKYSIWLSRASRKTIPLRT